MVPGPSTPFTSLPERGSRRSTPRNSPRSRVTRKQTVRSRECSTRRSRWTRGWSVRLSPMAAPPPQIIKGRGATFNPGNRFRRDTREVVDDGWNTPARDEGDEPAPLRTIVTIQNARTIIARNDSPDIPFERSINPYQGCEHGCVYCYARPSHAYLDRAPGLDFEKRLCTMPNAADLARAALSRPG